MASALSTNEVTVLYNDVLFRAADSGGLSFWATALDNGTPTLAELTNIFVTSSEAQTFVDPVIRLYQAVFNRAPDAGGLAYWVGQEHAGVSFTTVVESFVGSAEFVSDYGASPNPTALINSLYLNVLGRAADSGGLSYWLGVLGTPTLASETTVMLGFVNSAEFIADTQSNIDTWLTSAANSALAGTTGSGLGTPTYPATLAVPDTLTVAQANTIYTTDGDTAAVYAVSDTAANLAAAGVDAAVTHATSITATTAATVTQANTIYTTDADTTAIYAVSDTAANIITDLAGGALAATAPLAHAISVTATGATVTQATTLVAAGFGTGTASYALADTLANLTGATAIVAGAASYSLTNTAGLLAGITVAQAALVAGATDHASYTYSLSDTAAHLAVGGSAVTDATTSITATGVTTVAQATAILALDTGHVAFTYTLADTLADLTAAGAGIVSGAAAYSLTDASGLLVSITVAEAILVASAADHANYTYSLADSLAHLAAAPSGIVANAASYLLIDAAGLLSGITVAEAVLLAGATDHASYTYSLADTLAHLEAASAIVAGAASYSLTDAAGALGALTAANALLVIGATDHASYTFSVSDTAANVQAAQATLEANIASITGVALSDSGHILTLNLTASAANLTTLVALINELTVGGDTLAVQGAAADLISSEATITGATNYADVSTITATDATVTVAIGDTLAADYGSKLAPVAISDTAANVQTAQTTLETNIGHISAIALSDSGHTLTLNLTAAAANLTALVALVNKLTDGSDTVTLSGAAADLITSAGTITGAAHYGADITTVAITDASVTAAQADTLVADYGGKLAGVGVVDTAAAVGAAQATLETNIGQITSIQLSDGTTQILTLNLTAGSANLTGLVALVNKLTTGIDTVTLSGAAADLIASEATITGATNYSDILTVAVTNASVSAANAVTLVSDYGIKLGTVAVSDTAANVGTNLGSLIADVSHVSSLALTNATPATLSYTVAGSTADGTGLHTLLTDLTANTNVTLALSGTTTNLEADYDGGAGLTGTYLLTLVSGSKLAAVTVTDTSAVTQADYTALTTDFGALFTYSVITAGAGPETFDRLAVNGTINFGVNDASMTVDQLGPAASDTLAVNFTATGLTVTTLQEGNGGTGFDSKTVTINNDSGGMATIDTLKDGATTEATTTLVVTDTATTATTDIDAITATALTTINLGGTSGAVTIGSGTALTQTALAVTMGTGVDTLNIGGSGTVALTLTGALSTDVFNVEGTGTNVIHGLADGSTVTDTATTGTTMAALTVDLAAAGTNLTVAFGAVGDTITTLTEGGTSGVQFDAATVTIHNPEASGTSTIGTLTDGYTGTKTTTTLVVTNVPGATTVIGAISDTALTTINLGETTGAVTIGSGTALTQAALAVTLGTGVDTIDIAAASATTVALTLTGALSTDVFKIGGLGTDIIHGLNATAATVADNVSSTTTTGLTVDQVAAGTALTFDFGMSGDTITTVTEGGTSGVQFDAATVTIDNTSGGTTTIGTLTDGYAGTKTTATLDVTDAASTATTVIGAISDTALTTINLGGTSGTVTIGSGTALTQSLTVTLGSGTDTIDIGAGTDAVTMGVGTDTLNIAAAATFTATVTLTDATNSDLFHISGAGTDVIHGLAAGSTVTDNAGSATVTAGLTVDLATAGGDLTVVFAISPDTITTLTEGGTGTGQYDAATVTINNQSVGTATIGTLTDGTASNATTTLDVTDTAAGATTDINTISDSALTTIDLSGTSGAVTIGSTTALDQDLTITLGSGADTLFIAAGTDAITMGSGTDTLNIASSSTADVTLTSALSTDVFNIGGTGTDIINGLADSSTVTDASTGVATTALTVDVASGGTALTFDFGKAGDTIDTLTEGNGAKLDATAVTINNDAPSGTTTINTLTDGATTNATTTLNIQDGGAADILTIGAINDTALTTIALHFSHGTINIGTTAGLTQSGLSISMGAGADTIGFAQSAPSQANADALSQYSGLLDTLKLGTITVFNGTVGADTDTFVNGFDTTAGSTAAFLSNIENTEATGIGAYNDGTNTWVASVNGSGDLTNVVELVGVHDLTAVSLAAGATTVLIG